MQQLRTIATATILCAAWFGTASAQSPGVTDKEIRIGTIQDLSGPIVQLSKQVIYGMQMRVDEVNAAGGINGRQIKLYVEDHGYDPKKSVLAAQKLIEQTGIFAITGLMGSPTSVATLPVLEEAKVLNLFPLTGHVAMSEPLPMRWSTSPHYDDQIRTGIKEMIKAKGYKTVCSLYQDDDFGQEVQRGAVQGMTDLGSALKETTTYKRGATDFSSQVAKLQSAGCQLVILGAILREPPLIIAEAKKIGWSADFLSSTASHTTGLPRLGGKDVEGFYTMTLITTPYADDPNPALRDWFSKFKTKFNTDPDVFAVYGWEIIDLFIKAAQAAGPNLTTDAYVKTMEGLKTEPDMFGASYAFGPKQHQGANTAWISQIKDGRWVAVTSPVPLGE
ncbi:MAG: ABC transporter substrate-binding protein [Beijerinckiaceae bacterium]